MLYALFSTSFCTKFLHIMYTFCTCFLYTFYTLVCTPFCTCFFILFLYALLHLYMLFVFHVFVFRISLLFIVNVVLLMLSSFNNCFQYALSLHSTCTLFFPAFPLYLLYAHNYTLVHTFVHAQLYTLNAHFYTS